MRRPGPPLDRFVDRLWSASIRAAYDRERALPTCTVELVISLQPDRFQIFQGDSDRRGQLFHGSVVCGPQSSYFVLDTSQAASVVGVHFRPGRAAPFLGAPASAFQDRHLALEDVWGAQAHRLRERLLEAPSLAARFDLLEHALLDRLAQPPAPHPAALHALFQLGQAPAVARIGEIQRETGYSSRHFIKLFRDAVGLTPKLFCRIRRFQTVIDRLARGERAEWAQVALDSGYYDQPHLNREFRAFAGVTPGAYEAAERRPYHVPV